MQTTAVGASALPGLPRGLSLRLALGFLAAAVCGLLTGLLWRHLDLPDHPLEGVMAAAARPQGLGRFLALAGPAALLLPSLVLGIMALLLPREEGARTALDRALQADALSYLACPLWLLMPLLWRDLGNAFAALGLIYLGLVSLKAAILLSLLWRGFLCPAARGGGALAARAMTAVFLCLWVVLGLLAAWENQAISSSSDEVGYLLLTHSLTTRGGFNVFPALEAKEYLPFYWARFSPALAQSAETAQAWLFPFLLAPAYWLGGRLGVLVMNAGLMALLAGQLLAWLDRLKVAPAPAAMGVGLALMSAPVFFLSQQVYPDVPAMLLLVAGLRLLPGLAERPTARGLGLIAVACALALLKLRLLPLGLGLLLAGGMQLLARRWGWVRAWAGLGALLAAAGLAAWLLPQESWPEVLRRHAFLANFHMREISHWWQPMVIFFTGLGWDQTFGVFMAAPLFLLALAALPAAWRENPAAASGLVLTAALYLGLVCLTRWFQWYAGFSIPGRFAAVLMPLGAWLLALAWDRLQAPWWRLVFLAPALWGLLYAWLGSLTPQLRFSKPLGYNPLLGAVAANLDLDLHQLLPSALIKSPALAPWLVLTLAAGMLLAWRLWRGGRALAAPLAPAFSRGLAARTDLLFLPLLGLLLGAGALGAAKTWPPRFLEAEQMESAQAAPWTEYAYPRMMRGLVFLDGQSARGRITLPGGKVRITLVGWHDVEEGGRVAVRVGGKAVVGLWPYNQRALALTPVDLPAGRQTIEVSWRACAGRDCSLLLDRIEVEEEP